jgi:DNA-binding GntR family transcriptional regulator
VADTLPDPNGFQRPQRLSDHVYEELKALILSNQLQPGEALTEERFAAQWHISRTPLRAALVRLERDGLVRILPHRGCVITDITPQDVESVYQVREALEVLATQLATPLMPNTKLDALERLFAEIAHELERGCYDAYISSDAVFHAAILTFVPNTLLTQMLEQIYDRITRIRNFSHTQPGEHMREAFNEHIRILAAIRHRDAELAGVAMRDHLRNVTRRAISLLDQPVRQEEEAR